MATFLYFFFLLLLKTAKIGAPTISAVGAKCEMVNIPQRVCLSGMLLYIHSIVSTILLAQFFVTSPCSDFI